MCSVTEGCVEINENLYLQAELGSGERPIGPTRQNHMSKVFPISRLFVSSSLVLNKTNDQCSHWKKLSHGQPKSEVWSWIPKPTILQVYMFHFIPQKFLLTSTLLCNKEG
ncbi:hypothetical protein T265_12178 [Opisthorchis viverrini]|uniref:Uncharacterized protein n=1 Tax=Opisthorchis viverrini TaxID=6198 RepID=A0A074YVE1_OPIVI|nr:hypothetical protein T265_12178 [Opisthorchis viverrini]KER18726.1 hypothetical protein T265_12178 [Opisthorchis viverrini]